MATTRSNYRNNEHFDPQIERTGNGKEIRLRIGLPGVIEEQIRLDLEKTTLTLSVLQDGTTMKKAIRVPKGTRIYKKKFSDGMLEIYDISGRRVAALPVTGKRCATGRMKQGMYVWKWKKQERQVSGILSVMSLR